MKIKNGYTLIELIIVIALLGAATIFIAINISKNFKEDTKEAYNSQIRVILAKSKEYGDENIEEIKANSTVITVNKLIEEGFLVADENGNIINPENKSAKLNDLKIRITYDEETKNIIAELVE